jgi:hypothetical protein
MRRIAIIGAFVGLGILILRARVPELHQRLMARCEGMFERMPDTFPPKRAMRGIEEIRVKTARILELLEARKDEADKPEVPDASLAEAVHHGA